MKKHSDHFFENVSAIIQASFRLLLALYFPQIETARRSSLQDDRHLVCSRATSGFTLSHPSQLYLVCFQFLFFSTTKIKKRFSFRISSSLILFRAVSLHMNSFVKFEFLISWNLWNRKLKIQFELRYQAKISKLKIIV